MVRWPHIFFGSLHVHFFKVTSWSVVPVREHSGTLCSIVLLEACRSIQRNTKFRISLRLQTTNFLLNSQTFMPVLKLLELSYLIKSLECVMYNVFGLLDQLVIIYLVIMLFPKYLMNKQTVLNCLTHWSYQYCSLLTDSVSRLELNTVLHVCRPKK